MMAVTLWSLMILVIPYMVITASTHTVKILYKPSTPKVCREMCLASTDVFNYMREDSSCRRIAANSSGHNDKLEDFETFQEPEMGITGTASVGGQSEQKTSDKNTTDGGSLPVVKSLTPKAKASREMKLPKCKPVINLHKACQKGKVDTVRTILSRGLEDINCRGFSGRTPVMTSARHGRVTVFKYLVSNGCDLSVVDDHNDTVLHTACAGGNTDIVRRLIHYKIFNVDVRGSQGRTPLMFAAFCGHIKVIKLLMSKGSDLREVTYANDNALHWACRGGRVSVVKYVFSTGIIDIDSKGRYGQTPAMKAVYHGHRSVFDFLRTSGCSLRVVDHCNNNMLHLVCRGGILKMVKYILSLNVYGLDSREKRGRTPVMIAVRFGKRKIVQLLVRRGCNMKAVDDYGNTAIHIACIEGHLDLLKYIIKFGVEGIRKRNKHGQTPLQLAKSKRRQAIIAFLIMKDGIRSG